jgi:CheY-like chemotaxis protein
MTTTAKNILFADFAVVKYNNLIELLKKEGMKTSTVTTEKLFLDHLAAESFDLCVLNLLLSGIGPFELIRSVRAKSRNPDIKIIVISKQVQKLNIQNTIKAGANDFVADPVDDESLHNRILYQLTPKKVIENLGVQNLAIGKEALPVLEVMLEATTALSRTEASGISRVFYEILGKVGTLLGSNRTSMMIVDEEHNAGVVLASSDDPKFCDFQVVLSKYPEVLDVVHSGNFILIDDVSKNQLTQQINESVRSISIGSMMVFPVRYANEVVGVLTIRRAKASDLPSMETLHVLQALANTVAAHANIKASLRRIYRDFKPLTA